MSVASVVDFLRGTGLIDPGVLAVGIERGWASRGDVVAYAVEALRAGNERAEVMEIVTADDLELDRLTELLREWARLDGLPSARAENAVRRWMFSALSVIAHSNVSPEKKLDKLEETYADFAYPEEMRACSRYYMPLHDRARGIQIGELTDSPLDAMNRLLSKLTKEFEVQ